MTAKLAVTVAVDMDVASVTLRPAGRITPENVHGLLALVPRAKSVLSGFDLLLDLAQLYVVSPEALRTLSESGAELLCERLPLNAPPRGFRPDPASRAAA